MALNTHARTDIIMKTWPLAEAPTKTEMPNYYNASVNNLKPTTGDVVNEHITINFLLIHKKSSE